MSTNNSSKSLLYKDSLNLNLIKSDPRRLEPPDGHSWELHVNLNNCIGYLIKNKTQKQTLDKNKREK